VGRALVHVEGGTGIGGCKVSIYDLRQSIQDVVDSRLSDLNTACPGLVTAYDPQTQLATVQPQIQKLRFDETDTLLSESQPLIYNVPVLFPGTDDFDLVFPIVGGQTKCLLVWSQQSLDDWLATGNESPAIEQRRGQLSDAIAYVGITDGAHPRPLPPTDGLALRSKRAGSVALQILVASDRIELGLLGPPHTVALGDVVQTYLQSVHDWLAGLVLPVSGGSAGPPLSPPPSVPILASAQVKVS